MHMKLGQANRTTNPSHSTTNSKIMATMGADTRSGYGTGQYHHRNPEQISSHWFDSSVKLPRKASDDSASVTIITRHKVKPGISLEHVKVIIQCLCDKVEQNEPDCTHYSFAIQRNLNAKRARSPTSAATTPTRSIKRVRTAETTQSPPPMTNNIDANIDGFDEYHCRQQQEQQASKYLETIDAAERVVRAAAKAARQGGSSYSRTLAASERAAKAAAAAAAAVSTSYHDGGNHGAISLCSVDSGGNINKNLDSISDQDSVILSCRESYDSVDAILLHLANIGPTLFTEFNHLVEFIGCDIYCCDENQINEIQSKIPMLLGGSQNEKESFMDSGADGRSAHNIYITMPWTNVTANRNKRNRSFDNPIGMPSSRTV